MTVERGLRLVAGIVILVSVTLGMIVNRHWYWLTAFVGLNLFQSAFTNWCPAMFVLKKCGLRESNS
jgi:hypothetical protein